MISKTEQKYLSLVQQVQKTGCESIRLWRDEETKEPLYIEASSKSTNLTLTLTLQQKSGRYCYILGYEILDDEGALIEKAENTYKTQRKLLESLEDLKTVIRLAGEDIKERFLNDFYILQSKRSVLDTWESFLAIFACTIANAPFSNVPESERPAGYKRREKERLAELSNYTPKEQVLIEKMMDYTRDYFADNPQRDFLGCIAEELRISRYYTFKNCCQFDLVIPLASHIVEDKIRKELQQSDYASISASDCKSGLHILSTALACKQAGIDYTTSVLFAAQSLKRIDALTSYVQMSLLGCAGYVILDNNLGRPLWGLQRFCHTMGESRRELWITPAMYSDPWRARCYKFEDN